MCWGLKAHCLFWRPVRMRRSAGRSRAGGLKPPPVLARIDPAGHIRARGLKAMPVLARVQILQVIFGQELPDEATSFQQQAFAVGVAAIGLAAFALVLALVEQVVLQVVDENVARGSRVFETGHVCSPSAPAALYNAIPYSPAIHCAKNTPTPVGPTS